MLIQYRYSVIAVPIKSISAAVMKKQMQDVYPGVLKLFPKKDIASVLCQKISILKLSCLKRDPFLDWEKYKY